MERERDSAEGRGAEGQVLAQVLFRLGLWAFGASWGESARSLARDLFGQRYYGNRAWRE